MDEIIKLPRYDMNIVGVASKKLLPCKNPESTILLIHYPAYVNLLGQRYKLILAGHSHGGQVRIPFFGPLLMPQNVDKYDAGLFNTEAGKLYVNSGIGYTMIPVRFNCRPEITVLNL